MKKAPPKILIVEDNRDNLALMEYLLRAFGYAPETARDGIEGLEAIGRGRFELIICDLEMPRMDGYEFARQLESRGDWKNVPLIAVTALAMVGDRDKVLAAGFDGYISKPIVAEEFTRQVEAFLPASERLNHSPAVSTATTEAIPRPAISARILVVDDSAVNLNLIQSTLEPFGYEVIATRSPMEALRLARQASVDLILSDVHMAEQSGIEFCREVKQDAELCRIPFLLISSSYPEMQEIEIASTVGRGEVHQTADRAGGPARRGRALVKKAISGGREWLGFWW